VRKSWILLAIMALFVPVLFMGCGGSSGATGATGPAGPAGPPGSGTATGEACKVCHSAGRIADVAVMMPQSTAKDVNITVTAVDNVGGLPRVAVHLQDSSANPITSALFATNRLAFYIADLVPANTPTNATLGTQSSPYFKRWASENLTTVGGVVDTTDNANGNYVYTFVTPFSTLGTAGVDYADLSYTSDTHIQRLVVTWRPLDASLYNRASKTFDFNVPASGVSATELVSQRMFVTAENCRKCHSSNWEKAAHASSYRDTRVCVICHSPFYNAAMHDEGVQLSQFIHKIHAAIDVPAFPTRILGNGYVDVTFPQDVRNCATICHNNDSGEAVGAGNLVDNWKNHPNAAACGSCHVNVNFTTGANHAGGAQPDANCTVCHQPTGPITATVASVTAAHDTTPAAKDTPEFDVTISMTPPANGTHYVTGETPVVTVTLNQHGGGPVASSVYTSAQGAAGVSGGGLRSASLYVYGPRAKSVPVLTTNSTTDPALAAGTVPTQGHSLLVGGTDSLVITDSTGFKYQLMAIPAGMTAGTYMVRFEGADYAGVTSSDYVTSSTAVINFQVGTATPSLKVAGNGCLNCHGDSRMHLTGTHAHNAPFDTDHCLGCHDQSDNHGDPIANRVHAVHSANSDGDIFNFGSPGTRDWSGITYPQNIVVPTSTTPGEEVRCTTCHNSGNTSFQTYPYMMPCSGCHVKTGNGALDHMRQNGGPF
jgi:OmcA/MtrC family decaheme c-type cytochrome